MTASNRALARNQSLSWAMGHPYHDPVTNECCPDFSCCHPELFTRDDAERWRTHNTNYSAGARQ